MGLDQIAYARRGKPKKVETGTTTWLDGKGVERIEKIFEWEWDDQIQIGEWRNHSALQSWMEAKWISKKRPISKYINKDYYEENVFNNVSLNSQKRTLLNSVKKFQVVIFLKHIREFLIRNSLINSLKQTINTKK